MIHKPSFNPQPVTTFNLDATKKILKVEDNRVESILKERTKLTDEQWAHLDRHDLWLSAQEAVEVGVADEVAEFTPPKGTTLLAI